ncbi:winged helix-turn-helix transcriptional regulator [Burkholderia anthina]|uniref:winged helix-turn-helix transcriptional regulator n=1 Tax=Burkholderia anthina TaxID=179879 RepID=UPI00158C4CCF|nr:helix-turn-helix domain-containing protein [Burkholderia anthina]
MSNVRVGDLSCLDAVYDINVFDVNCPANKLVSRIGDKWTLLIIYSLSQGVKRYSQLQDQVHGISPKMLTQTLRRLERDGIIVRTAHPEVPPRVEYRLSSLGVSLVEPLAALCVWAEDHYEELQQRWTT